jgi:hypothetical protein
MRAEKAENSEKKCNFTPQLEDIIKWDLNHGKIYIQDIQLGEIAFRRNYLKVKSKKIKYTTNDFYYFDILKAINRIEQFNRNYKNATTKKKLDRMIVNFDKNIAAIKLYILKSLFAIHDELGSKMKLSFFDKKSGTLVTLNEDFVSMIKRKDAKYKEYKILYKYNIANEIFLIKQYADNCVDSKVIREKVLPVLNKRRGSGKTINPVDMKSVSKKSNSCSKTSSPSDEKSKEQLECDHELKITKLLCKDGKCEGNSVDEIKTIAFLNGELRALHVCCLRCIEQYEFKGYNGE